MVSNSDLLASVKPKAGWERVELLVTVKAYPAMSQKYGESVCVAGVRTDRKRPEWIRLFPVGFRKLPADRKFKKYQRIALRVRRGSTDRRPESWQPDLESLVCGPVLSSRQGRWTERWRALGDLAGATTTCELLSEAKLRGQAAPSLGLVKPRRVRDVVVLENPEYRPGSAEHIDVDLFGDERSVLEATPFTLRYVYSCLKPGCTGHNQSIVDWEAGQAGRKWLRDHTEAETRDLLRDKFLGELCGPDRDTHLYVGNQHQHPAGFLVLGVFSPKVGSRPADQLTLGFD